MDPLFLTGIITILFLLGIVGSVLPMMPGALLSVAGILIYAWQSKSPNWLFISFGLFLSISAIVFDWLSGYIGAKLGGATGKTSLAAGVAGFLGFIFLGGPLGMLLAVAGTVFVREYLINNDFEKSGKAAVYASVTVMGSTVVQAGLTSLVLIGFLITLLF